MTQDQCLDNGHQPKSNNHSTSDQVSDDLQNSKNTFVSNGVNSLQEFNVGHVNSNRCENRNSAVDLVIDHNCTVVDADCPATGKVLTAETSSSINFLNTNSVSNDKSDRIDNIMTVITHQNSSENIRDIITNSEKVNNKISDSEIEKKIVSDKSDNNKSTLNTNVANSKSGAIRKNRKLIRSENVNEREDDKPEDPSERLNKLRASISSALSEVKGVLKQYSTDQSIDGENESTSSKTADDGPVRFRFVRKIRRRSAFSEDDETEIPKTLSVETPVSPIVEQKVNQESSANDLPTQQIPLINAEQDQDKKETLLQTVPADICLPTVSKETETSSSKIPDEKKPPEEGSSISSGKLKTVKTKKVVVKKDRRASIAAVEINKAANELSLPKLELKTRRRPSDSGTVVKEPTQVKTNDKPKSQSLRKRKTGTVTKTEESSPVTQQNVSQSQQLDQTASESSETSFNKEMMVSSSVNQQEHSESIAVENLPSVNHQSPIPTEVSPADTSVNIISDVPKPIATVETPAKEDPPKDTSLPPTQPEPKETEANPPQAETVEDTIQPEPIIVDTSPETASKDTASLPEQSSVPALNPPNDSSQLVISNQINKEPQTTDSAKAELPENTTSEAKSTDLVQKPDTQSDLGSVTAVKEVISSTSSTVSTQSDQSLETSASEPQTKVDAGLKPSEADSIEMKETQLIQSSVSKVDSKTITVEKPTNVTDAAKTSEKQDDSSKTKPVESTQSNVSIAEKPQEPKDTLISVTSTSQKKVDSSKAKPPQPIQSNASQNPIVEKPRLRAVFTKLIKTSQEQADPKKSNVSKAHSKASTAEKPKKAEGTPTTVKSSSQKKVTKETQPSSSDSLKLSIETDVPKPLNVPKDAIAVKFNLPGQESVDELHRLEQNENDDENQSPTISEASAPPPPPLKKKKKAKRKVVIRRIKRKLSIDHSFLQVQEGAAELEICEKEIQEKEDEEDEGEAEVVPVKPKSCLKVRAYEIGDVVMYAEHYKKTQVRWKKATVVERITSISYKLDINGEERPAHISYIKKFTDRKVNFGGKEYLEIDYAQIEEDEEKERNYSIWNLV